MKNIPNIISASRIVLSVLLLFLPVPSVWFYVIYAMCGVTDVLDGYLARKLRCVTRSGSVLDSVADAVLFVCLLLRFLMLIDWKLWVVICVAAIALLRVISVAIGLIRFKKFMSIHTFANKIAGTVVFISPVLYGIFKSDVTVIIAVVAAVLSSVEEIALLLRADEPDIDKKGLFF